ncbi:Aste57867_23418 [Aphanomyces stellatus]|uniref:Aste57867_23418 protein n=1 Tax=Aphanomyces stellatus TaxID=120398 RepID=A0A485LMT5_9STRA|nr:hypothetical protein As57867_023347 [Aphanomyces stellatus]VFU00064.1 Aste57867_23418 [Aphanomyces stellatus]
MGQILSNCCNPEEDHHHNFFRRRQPALDPDARVIRVVLEKATDLPASDPDMLGGKSDPYVTFQFGKERRRTDVIGNTLDPVWKHQEYQFTATDRDVAVHKLFKIRVMDHDTVSADDLLGELEFDLTQWTGATRLADAAMQPYKLTVPECFALQGCKPEIHMTISFLTPWEAAARLTEEIWENERWLSTSNAWSKNYLRFGDKHAWTSSNGKLGGAAFSNAIPDIPAGYTQEGTWQFDISHGDQNGWVYASSFAGPWRKERSKLCFVRRRLWVAHFTRDIVQPPPNATMEVELTAAAAATTHDETKDVPEVAEF